MPRPCWLTRDDVAVHFRTLETLGRLALDDIVDLFRQLVVHRAVVFALFGAERFCCLAETTFLGGKYILLMMAGAGLDLRVAFDCLHNLSLPSSDVPVRDPRQHRLR